MQNEIKDLRVELTRNRRQSINNLKFYKGVNNYQNYCKNIHSLRRQLLNRSPHSLLP